MRTLFKSMAIVALTATTAISETQGVTDSEVLIGSNQDMSGPFAAFGAPAVQAAKIYFDEINAAGGVHGRQIRMVVEDHAYQMPKAMSGLNKLVNSDKVFAMLLSLGTPMNIASFPLLESKQIANVSPLTAARQMAEPPSNIKYAGTSSYHAQMLAAVPYVAEQTGAKTICSMYIPSDFGLEIAEGTHDAVKANGLTFGGETKHKPDELDFVGSISKLASQGCEVITVALGVRQAITAVATAKKMGLTDLKFIGSSASFHTAIAKVPGGVTEGFYAAAGWSDILARMGHPDVAKWVASYQGATGEFPGSGALLGRSAAETLVRALEAAGHDLTPESFQAGMESLSFEDTISDVQVDYSADDHQGADLVVISQIQEGNWTELVRK
ncbi:ABC transporter substrate-binding protein [Rhodobacteraceae bacterium nBUS_22]